ncbi:hypothetical protein BC835DRAFT_1413739 [Cytidiella melzeri]|nr:hypothetical protein BC835DRAFT_1413739 [Cytidiella melzeri]
MAVGLEHATPPTRSSSDPAQTSYINRVITDINAPSGTGNPPIFGTIDTEDDVQVWEYDSYKQTICNKSTGLYAYPEDTTEGSCVLERK